MHRSEMHRIEREYDVVVIGAGATGLTAALRLHEEGRSVLVLEARDRVGGRLETRVVDGQMLELGGQWVSPDQTALLETLDELGLATYSRYRDGESVYIGADGRALRFTGDIFPGTETTEAEIERLIGLLDRLVSRPTRPPRGRIRSPTTTTASASAPGSSSRQRTRRRAPTSRCSSPTRCSPSPPTRSRCSRRC